MSLEKHSGEELSCPVELHGEALWGASTSQESTKAGMRASPTGGSLSAGIPELALLWHLREPVGF